MIPTNERFYHRQACETQLKMLPVGLDNLNLIPEEARKVIYDASRKAPEGYETKANQIADNNKDNSVRAQVCRQHVSGLSRFVRTTHSIFSQTNGVSVELNSRR